MTKVELSETLALLVLAEQRRCKRCGHRRLELLEVKPDPNFGALGVTVETLRCQVCKAVELE